MLVLTLPVGEALGQWSMQVLLWGVDMAVVPGGAPGYADGRLIRWAVANDIGGAGAGTFHACTVALSLLTMGAPSSVLSSPHGPGRAPTRPAALRYWRQLGAGPHSFRLRPLVVYRRLT